MADMEHVNASEADTWRMHTADRAPWLRSYLGNGRITVQLVAEGGLAGALGSPLHLMAELYDRAEGREVEHPVPLPDWSSLALQFHGRVLRPDEAMAYSQTLDLRHGQAHTTHRWDLDGLSLEATTTLALLRHEPNLALVQITLRADRACQVSVGKSLGAQDLPALDDGEVVSAEGGYLLTTRTRERRIPLAIAGRFIPDIPDSRTIGDENRVSPDHTPQWGVRRNPAIRPPPPVGGSEARVSSIFIPALTDLQPGQPCTVTWLTAIHSGRTADDPAQAAQADLRRACNVGVDQLLADHAAAWEALWQSDIVIEGDPAVQRFARAGLFGLYCSARSDVPSSIAPMGLSSLGYNGHIFWDADTWMFPPLLLLQPDLARGMLTYRQERLPAALARAAAEGYQGAMFPWESATDGSETTPLSIARTGLKEHHITACVALAQWQYFLATDERAWLAERAWPILEAAARFWISRAVRNAAGGYEIHDVIAADEYAEDVNNDAFTNGAARAALLAAVEAARILDRPAPAEWERVAAGLILARDGDLVLEFDGYDGRVIKQGDVELLTYPLEHPLSEPSIALNLETYRRVTDPEGPAMGGSISAVVAAQLGRRAEARALFAGCYEPNLWGPFYALAETRSNGEVNFLTGVGGALQTLLFGFAGLRLHREAPAVDPLLPDDWRALRFPALHWRGHILSLAMLPGDRLEIGLTLAGTPITIALRRWRPGPDPLRVMIDAPIDANLVLEAGDWSITPLSLGQRSAAPSTLGHAWDLRPPAAGPTSPFVSLTFSVRVGDERADFSVEQRVRSGDD